MSGNMSKDNDSVSSVMKVFGILQAISEEPHIGITELSKRILMPKSTVYRFLQTMKEMGYVAQEEDNDQYNLTLKLFELASKALQHLGLIKSADNKMRLLSKRTKETIHLGIIEHDNIVYVHKIDSHYSLRMHSIIGRHHPVYSTAIGKVLLAWLDETEIREILKDANFMKFTENTLDNIDALLAQLQDVRKYGYGFDNEEMEIGLLCIAAPIFDRFGKVIAGLSISYPKIRIDITKKQFYIELLHQYANELSQELGFHDYPEFEKI